MKRTNMKKGLMALLVLTFIVGCGGKGDIKNKEDLSLEERCEEITTEVVEVPYEIEKQEDEKIFDGNQVVKEEGIAGEKEIIYCDGVVEEETVTKEAEKEIVLVSKKDMKKAKEEGTVTKKSATEEKVIGSVTEKGQGKGSTSNKGNGNSTADKGKDKDKGNGSTNGGNTKPENKPETKPEEKPKPPVDNGNTKPPVKPPVDNGGGNTKPPVKPPIKDPVKTQKDVTTTETIGFQTTYVDNPNLDKGTERVKTNGVNGTRTIVTRIYYTDGKETSRSQVSNSVTTNPVNKVIERGTKVKPSGPVVPANPADIANSGKIFKTMEEASAFGRQIVFEADYDTAMYWKNKLGFSVMGYFSDIILMTDGSYWYTVEFY